MDQFCKYIFGYGSLLNPQSRKNTFEELELFQNVKLRGYRRVLNACHESYSHIAMNIEPALEKSVEGVVVAVSEADMPALLERELGYDMIEVTKQLSKSFSQPVYTFMMPNPVLLPQSEFRQEYLNLCLLGVPESERRQWLLETEFPNTYV